MFDHLITLVSLFLAFSTNLYHKKVMIFINIFQPPPTLMIEIIISVNDENDGWPLSE